MQGDSGVGRGGRDFRHDVRSLSFPGRVCGIDFGICEAVVIDKIKILLKGMRLLFFPAIVALVVTKTFTSYLINQIDVWTHISTVILVLFTCIS